jgi:hypothetical protein
LCEPFPIKVTHPSWPPLSISLIFIISQVIWPKAQQNVDERFASEDTQPSIVKFATKPNWIRCFPLELSDQSDILVDYCCGDIFSPELNWKILFLQEGLGLCAGGLIAPFSYWVLPRGVRSRDVKCDSVVGEEFLEFVRSELAPPSVTMLMMVFWRFVAEQ